MEVLVRSIKGAARFPAASPTRRRGKKSLLIRRDATLSERVTHARLVLLDASPVPLFATGA